MSAETFKKYGDVTIYHDGPRNAEHFALVLGARYDSGVTLGPDGEPAVTLAYLNPATPQNGPLRGNLMDSFIVMHDVQYLATEDLGAVGYSDRQFSYPVATAPTIEEQLAAAQKQINDLEAQVKASQQPPQAAPMTPAPVEPVAAPTPEPAASAEPPKVEEPVVVEPAAKVE